MQVLKGLDSTGLEGNKFPEVERSGMGREGTSSWLGRCGQKEDQVATGVSESCS